MCDNSELDDILLQSHMSNTRGTIANPIPSHFNPLIERLARLYMKSHGFQYEGGYEEFFRSRNPRVKEAVQFAMLSIQELEE